MVQVYVCFDAQLADRVTHLLREAGTEPLIEDHGSKDFPTNVGTESSKVVMVSEDHAELARKTLKAALEDGVLPADGGELR